MIFIFFNKYNCSLHNLQYAIYNALNKMKYCNSCMGNRNEHNVKFAKICGYKCKRY